MKKNKLLSVILMLTMLSGCANDSSAPSENNARIVWTYGNADERGELFTDNTERLHFIDFETMNSALLCSKPNCTHTDENECSAFGMYNHPILYDNTLYFFDWKINFDGEEMTDTTIVYKANADGTNRVKVCDIDGLALSAATRMLIVNDTLYFSMDKTGWNEDMTASSGYNEVWFCSFDFSTETFKRIEMLHNGWASGAWILGLFDGKVIFRYDYSEEKVPILEDPSEIVKYITSVYKAYDIETETLTDLALPVPTYVSDGYYIYEKDGSAVVLSENGKEMTIPNLPIESYMNILNGKLFNFYEQICVDLSNGKKFKLNSSDDLIIYLDGNYILRGFDGASQTNNYYKISEKDYIGDEI